MKGRPSASILCVAWQSMSQLRKDCNISLVICGVEFVYVAHPLFETSLLHELFHSIAQDYEVYFFYPRVGWARCPVRANTTPADKTTHCPHAQCFPAQLFLVVTCVPSPSVGWHFGWHAFARDSASHGLRFRRSDRTQYPTDCNSAD